MFGCAVSGTTQTHMLELRPLTSCFEAVILTPVSTVTLYFIVNLIYLIGPSYELAKC